MVQSKRGNRTDRYAADIRSRSHSTCPIRNPGPSQRTQTSTSPEPRGLQPIYDVSTATRISGGNTHIRVNVGRGRRVRARGCDESARRRRIFWRVGVSIPTILLTIVALRFTWVRRRGRKFAFWGRARGRLVVSTRTGLLLVWLLVAQGVREVRTLILILLVVAAVPGRMIIPWNHRCTSSATTVHHAKHDHAYKANAHG